MSEFCHGKKAGLLFRFIRGEQAEVSFQFLVYSFRFSVSLGVICSGKGDVILEEAGKFSGEGGSKLRPSVGNYLGVEAEPREDIGEEKLGYSFGVDVFSAGAINYPLSEPMVYHDHDSIISVRKG